MGALDFDPHANLAKIQRRLAFEDFWQIEPLFVYPHDQRRYDAVLFKRSLQLDMDAIAERIYARFKR